MFSRACPTTPAPQYEEEVDPRDALPAELVRVHIAHRRNAISPTTVTAASADGTCRLRANAVTAQADNADKHAPVPAPPQKL